MIRRPLFLGTLGFCGAILISYFLGKAAALGALGLLVFAWWQWRQAGDPAGSKWRSCDPDAKAETAKAWYNDPDGVLCCESGQCPVI